MDQHQTAEYLGEARVILGVVPPLPAGYTYEQKRFVHQGIRMEIAYKDSIFAEVRQMMKYVPESDDPVGIRYEARDTNYANTATQLFANFNNKHPWVEYPDMKTLISTVLTRHRIGANT